MSNGEAGSSDQQLIEATLAGDRPAFVELVKRHDAATRSVAFSTVGPNGPIEDVLQEGLLKAYRSLHTFRDSTNFRSWLCKIVHNAAIDLVRRDKKVTPIDSAEPVAVTPELSNEIIDRLNLIAALERLPMHYRAAVMLVDVEGFDYETAAAMLGVPRGTIASRINKAHKTLREYLSVMNKDNS